MFEDILNWINLLSPLWIYIVLFGFSYIENIFPPSPSDMVVVIGGTLIGTGAISFIPTLIFSSMGSVLGFMTLYYVGTKLDKKIVKSKKTRFISIEALSKVEEWFAKYGNWIIITNRFVPGTRSIVSLFAGLSEVDLRITVVLSTISALLWNAIILTIGMFFGKNIHLVDRWLGAYSNIAILLSLLVILFLVGKYLYKKKNKIKL